MEHPLAFQDIMVDDCPKTLLDAIELNSESFISAVRSVFAPFVELRLCHKLLVISYEVPHVKDDVVCIPRTIWRLLEAGKLSFVVEYHLA